MNSTTGVCYFHFPSVGEEVQLFHSPFSVFSKSEDTPLVANQESHGRDILRNE